MNKASKFPLGQVRATPCALEALAESGQDADFFLSRHIQGDWGVVDDEDWRANDEALLDAGAKVVAHDPVAMPEARHRLAERVEYAESNYDALEGSDALCVVTDWNEYRHPNFERIKGMLRRPIVVDGRNLYDPTKMQRLGFTYFSIGRGNA